jgi:hypothetical protein
MQSQMIYRLSRVAVVAAVIFYQREHLRPNTHPDFAT